MEEEDVARTVERIRRSFIRVHCERHARPWRIAEFEKGLQNPGRWSEIAGTSKARRLEQRRRKAEVAAMPPADPDNVGDLIARMIPGGDRPGHVTELEDGEVVDSGMRAAMKGFDNRPIWERPAQPERWRTYDLTCPRCKKAKRHATYRRREDALFQILDELVAHGITRVTPEFLHAYETRRAEERPC